MLLKEKIERAKQLYEQGKTLVSEAKEDNWEERATALFTEAEKLKDEIARQSGLIQRAKDLDSIKLLGGSEEPQPGESRHEFKDFANFLSEVWKATNPRVVAKPHPSLRWFGEDVRSGHELKVMTEQVGAAGGFLVPQEFQAMLLSVMEENSIVRPRASVIRMARRSIALPVLDQTGTTAGIPHWFGGMQFYWGEEAAEKTATDAAFRQVILEAKKLIGYTRASDELVEDSAISLGDFLQGPMGFAGGIAWMEDYAFLRGTGAGQPLGVINAGATITVARQATNPPVGFTDLANMREAFIPSGKGVWVINQSLMSNFITMSGPTGNASFVWQMNAVDGIPTQIFGYPVIWTEKMPAAGSAGDILLADFSYYLLGDRQATTIESTQFDYWRYDQTSWRAVHRVDGQPWLSTPLTLADGATTYSPFVILGAKST